MENTAPAFEAAIAADYGIECDVRPIKGGVPVVFHDATLNRLVEGRGPIAAVKESRLKALRYRVGGTTILTLSELLDLVAGRVPLLIEIKSEWHPPDRDFLANIAFLVSGYRGPIALMSFDPTVMATVRSLAPTVPRGIVSGRYTGAGWWSRKISRKRAAGLRDLLEVRSCGTRLLRLSGRCTADACHRVRAAGFRTATFYLDRAYHEAAADCGSLR